MSAQVRFPSDGFGAVVVIPFAMNPRGLHDALEELEGQIEAQATELPYDFCDDDSLELYVEAPDLLSESLAGVIAGFISRYTSVARRRELFFARWQIYQALDGFLVANLHDIGAEA